jgi:hypothetical protein
MASLFATGLLVLIGFLIYLIIIRVVFRIERNTRNQEATIYLLMKSWEKQGADPKEVLQFKRMFKVK